MRLIFSRNRAAQLDLLLRSLDSNAPGESPWVMYACSTDEHYIAYTHVMAEHPHASWISDRPSFNTEFRRTLEVAMSTVTFFCDDDVLYRPVPSLGEEVLAADARVLTFSLRLGTHRPYPYPFMAEIFIPRNGFAYWPWQDWDPHDFGYPGSIDGHTFRTADVLRMIDGQTIENPLMLETILAHRCSMLADERPLMACYPEQALVGVPVNTVADDQRRLHGERFPQPADELNARFLAGERIDLDALDFSGVDGCLHEISFVWRPRVAA